MFPVLDIIRLAVRHKKNNEVIASMNKGIIVEKIQNYVNSGCNIANNTIVALRTICNLCLHEPGETLVFESRFDLLENFTSLGQLNKTGQVSRINPTCLSSFKIDLFLAEPAAEHQY